MHAVTQVWSSSFDAIYHMQESKRLNTCDKSVEFVVHKFYVDILKIEMYITMKLPSYT